MLTKRRWRRKQQNFKKKIKTKTKSRKISRSNQQKKKNNFARAAHFFCTFVCRCFARRQRETSRNFPATRSCVPPICFTLLVTASISHFLTAAIKFSCYSSNEIGLLCLSLALAFSLLSSPMQTLKLRQLFLCYPRQCRL